MNRILEQTITLEQVVGCFESPWAWLGTYIAYCLTVGTIQCRILAKKSVEQDKIRTGRRHYLENRRNDARIFIIVC